MIQGLYYGVSICLVSFASAMAVVTLNIHHRGVRGNEVPDLVRRLFLGVLSRFVFLHFDASINKNWRETHFNETNPVKMGSGNNSSSSRPNSDLANVSATIKPPLSMHDDDSSTLHILRTRPSPTTRSRFCLRRTVEEEEAGIKASSLKL